MPTDIWMVILAFLPVYVGSIFLHEGGHALMAWMGGLQVTSFGMGLGAPVMALRWRGTRIYFALKSPSHGLTWVIYRQVYPPRFGTVAMLAGGIMANMLAAGGAALLWWQFD